jgi:hypothetical protein
MLEAVKASDYDATVSASYGNGVSKHCLMSVAVKHAASPNA